MTEDKKMDNITNEEQNDVSTEKKEENTASTEKKEENTLDVTKKPIEVIEKIAKGMLNLHKVIRSHGKEHTQLRYNLANLSGLEFAIAMDSDKSSRGFGISYQQGIALFAYSAARENKDVDAMDVIEQVGAIDGYAMSDIGRIFFVASGYARNMSISKA